MLPHSHSICHPTRSPAHFLLTPVYSIVCCSSSCFFDFFPLLKCCFAASAPDFDDVSSCASSASCSTHHVLIDVFINLQGCASSTEGARALYTYLFHCFLRDTYHSWLTLCSSSQKGESRTDTRKPTLLALLVRQTSHGLPLRPVDCFCCATSSSLCTTAMCWYQ